MIAAQRPRAPCTASTRSASPFDCRCSRSRPWRSASLRAAATCSSRVAVPYTSGSRSPSKFRFGPDNSSTVGLLTGNLLEGGLDLGGGDTGHLLHAARTVEDERHAPHRLLVPGHELDEVP